MCTGANCNETLQVNIPLATPGADGASAYLYIASADNSSGLNFSYPADPSQHYSAFLKTTSPITTPAAGDFTGLWTKYVGDDGINGTNGINGLDGVNNGIPFNFVNYGLSTNPGSGNVSVNGTALNLTSTINISDTDLNSVNIHAYLTALNTSASNLKAFVKFTKKGDESKYAIFSLNTATDTGTYFTLNVNYVSCTSANVFTASDDLYLTVYITGDKGDPGIPGPSGAFIIGTIAGGAQAYPAVSTYGSAYRATANGTLSDGGLGLSNVKRFFLNDILYCIADSTASDGTKWILWQGFPRPFYPGSGTDSFILNTILAGTASGIESLAARGSSVSGDYSTGLGRGGTITGDDSFDAGQGNTINSNFCFGAGTTNTIGTGSDFSLVAGTGNTIGNNSGGSVLIGRQNITGAGCIFSEIGGDYNAIDAAIQYARVRGTGVKASITNAEAIGAGTWGSGGTKGLKQTYRFPVSAVITGGSGTDNLSTMEGGSGMTVFTLPTKSNWLIKGRVESVINTGVNMGNLAIWDFSCQISNLAGTAALKGNILCLDDAGTYNAVATLATDLDVRIADAFNDSALQITGSGATISFNVVGATGVLDATTWSGIIEIVQLGWF